MDTDRSDTGVPFTRTARVSRAVRLVSTQADCDAEQALILMTTRAAASRVTVDDIADAVIDGAVRFD